MEHQFIQYLTLPMFFPHSEKKETHFFSSPFKKVCYGFLVVIGFSAITACSQYNQGLVSTSYHDLNSHYNAYFLANERLNEAEKILFAGRKDDYNELLSVLLPHDTLRGSTVKSQTDYAIEKASLPIQYHKNSHWLDDCYLMIAHARFLQADFDNAIETYKYVNSESKDDKLHHRALIGLLRAFNQTKNYDYSQAVINRLRKEKLSKHDLVDFYEARAQFHQIRQEYDQTLAILKQTVKRMPASERRARLYYIIGQLYQRTNHTKEGYSYFDKVHKSNASYELALQAKLQMIQLYANNDERKLIKRFKKLLRDEKNVEYKDRVYYAMGMYALRKEDYDKALGYFKEATQVKGGDGRQKTLAFLRLAELYYDKQQNYKQAKNYYDSTLNAGLSPTTPNYDVIVKRQKVLEGFVRNYETIQTEDSLQRLAKMDEASRNKFFDEWLDKREKEEREAERKRNDQIAQEVGAIFDNMNTEEKPKRNESTGSAWYFSNTTAMAQGRTAFARKWGNRPLEDNWRRSKKDISFADPTDPTSTASTGRAPQETKKPEKISREDQKKSMLANLPMSDEAMQKSNEKVETAYYELGKITDQELLEKEKAIKTYETLLERFPQTEHAAEVLYALYLIYQERGDDKQLAIREKLIQQYAGSTYARLAANPGMTRDENIADIQADRAFQEAYQTYEAQNFVEADRLIQSGIQQYKGTLNEQRFKILEIKLIGKTQGLDAYRKALRDFMNTYAQSSLLPYVHKLFQSAEGLTKNTGH